MSGPGAQAHEQLFQLEAFEAQADGGGGSAGAWRAQGRIWGRLAPVSAIERGFGEVVRSEVTHRLRLRWSPFAAASRPQPEHRLRLGARVFAITGVAEEGVTRRDLVCWLREGVRE